MWGKALERSACNLLQGDGGVALHFLFQSQAPQGLLPTGSDAAPVCVQSCRQIAGFCALVYVCWVFGADRGYSCEVLDEKVSLRDSGREPGRPFATNIVLLLLAQNYLMLPIPTFSLVFVLMCVLIFGLSFRIGCAHEIPLPC